MPAAFVVTDVNRTTGEVRVSETARPVITSWWASSEWLPLLVVGMDMGDYDGCPTFGQRLVLHRRRQMEPAVPLEDPPYSAPAIWSGLSACAKEAYARGLIPYQVMCVINAVYTRRVFGVDRGDRSASGFACVNLAKKYMIRNGYEHAYYDKYHPVDHARQDMLRTCMFGYAPTPGLFAGDTMTLARRSELKRRTLQARIDAGLRTSPIAARWVTPGTALAVQATTPASELQAALSEPSVRCNCDDCARARMRARYASIQVTTVGPGNVMMVYPTTRPPIVF